ncbi:MAG: sortase, partial [Streptococcaceae bacterium]|nr:sortase [Streptococcaceae bacterium]
TTQAKTSTNKTDPAIKNASAKETSETAPATKNKSEKKTAATNKVKKTTDQQPVTRKIPDTQDAKASENTNYKKDTLYIGGTEVPYKDGGVSEGQSIINGDPNGVASTWGGAPVQSGTDGMNTHFIGHNAGIFSCLLNLYVGSVVTVTDGNGVPTNYVVNSRHVTDIYGVDTTTKENLWNQITSTSGGERITLQTCLSEKTRLILFANKQ